MVERWTSYRDFWFDDGGSNIHEADMRLIREIASYMRDNPSLELGIDASTNPRATNERDLDLRDSRVQAIRASLVRAGVSADRIKDGMFGDADLRRDRQVEVFLRTARLSQTK